MGGTHEYVPFLFEGWFSSHVLWVGIRWYGKTSIFLYSTVKSKDLSPHCEEGTATTQTCHYLSVKAISRKQQKLTGTQRFPGSPVVRLLHFDCQTWVQSPVTKLRSHKLHSAAKTKKLTVSDLGATETWWKVIRTLTGYPRIQKSKVRQQVRKGGCLAGRWIGPGHLPFWDPGTGLCHQHNTRELLLPLRASASTVSLHLWSQVLHPGQVEPKLAWPSLYLLPGTLGQGVSGIFQHL